MPPTRTFADLPISGVDFTLPTMVDRVRGFIAFASLDQYTGFDKALVTEQLELVSARVLDEAGSDPSSGETVFRLTVLPELCNRMGNLHGGAAALIFDICTTTAIVPIAREGWWEFAGVTRSLNVTYLRPAPMGTKVTITSRIVHAGSRLMTIRGELRSEDGKLLCMAEHLKANIDLPKPKI